MSFLDEILENLRSASATKTLVQEIHGEQVIAATGHDLEQRVRAARAYLQKCNVNKGERLALLAANSIDWAAVDLAAMSEGIIIVPLYARQAPEELVALMRDSEPGLVCCGTEELRKAVKQVWPDAPRVCLTTEMTDPANGAPEDHTIRLTDEDPVKIIYTSGTSGEAKGVVLTTANITHMVSITATRLDQLVGDLSEQERIFHYLPFCFAGSWIMLLTCLVRGSRLSLSTDLENLKAEMKAAAPHCFQNVPTLLERVRRGVEEKIAERGGFVKRLFDGAASAWERRSASRGRLGDAIKIRLADALIYSNVRKQISTDLRALICGSAPLAPETQQFFLRMGIPVLQVYGLTETTAICTMDDANAARPGWVGRAIDGIQMKLGEHDEVLVRGPNIFDRYWNRPEATEQTFVDGWFRTGDQGEIDADGYWRIIGRLKNLVILNSGHNIAPEPIEEKLLPMMPGAKQVVLVGNNRGYLSAIVTGEVQDETVTQALERLNADLPHYKRIRAHLRYAETFSIENELLTANGKLRRDAIARRLAPEIDRMYQGNLK